ncbi:MAG TPA: D-tyrosyl-tRNA(Tyr) deacylase, partial [Rhodobacter sp.]|nr:D-tyrosyl-tRNA(Tyr) deacylase [Rhodobacter sp.]
MRALIQRVTKAQVAVDDQIMGAIEQGLFIFVCAMQGDT